MSIVVSDTSPIRALDHLGLLQLLQLLYGEILIPPGVAEELSRPTSKLLPLNWSKIPSLRVQMPTNILQIEQFQQVLDQGESEAIALALEVDATALLVDERAARSVATSFGVKVVGVLAVLISAKEQNLIPAVAPLMDQLQAGIDFRISQSLYLEIKRLSGE